MGTIDFNTTAYFRSHGKMPKGTGAWAFQVQTIARNPEPIGKVIFTPSMSYRDAKVWVRSHLRAKFGNAADWNRNEVVVLP